MEAIQASNTSVYVDTINGRVDIATGSYAGGISNVGLHIASNVVVDAPGTTNACVLYSTGSATCVSFVGDGSKLTGLATGASLSSTQTWSASQTFGASNTTTTVQGEFVVSKSANGQSTLAAGAGANATVGILAAPSPSLYALVVGTSTTAYFSTDWPKLGFSANFKGLVAISSAVDNANGQNNPVPNFILADPGSAQGGGDAGNPFMVGSSTGDLDIIGQNHNINFGAGSMSVVPVPSRLQISTNGAVYAGTAFSAPTVVATQISNTTNGLGSGTSPATIFVPILSSNAVTGALSGTFTNTTLGTCISGSTNTLNLPVGVGGVVSYFNGGFSDATLATTYGVGVIVDGGYVNGETSGKGLTPGETAVAGKTANMSFSVPITGLASGTHNFCLSAFVSAGTGTIESTISVSKFTVVMMP